MWFSCKYNLCISISCLKSETLEVNSCLSCTTCDGVDAKLIFYSLLHHKFTPVFHSVPAHPNKKMVFYNHNFCLVFGDILQKVDISWIIFCLGIKVYSVIMMEWLELNLVWAGYFLFIGMLEKQYIQVIKITKRYSNRFLLCDTYNYF